VTKRRLFGNTRFEGGESMALPAPRPPASIGLSTQGPGALDHLVAFSANVRGKAQRAMRRKAKAAAAGAKGKLWAVEPPVAFMDRWSVSDRRLTANPLQAVVHINGNNDREQDGFVLECRPEGRQGLPATPSGDLSTGTYPSMYATEQTGAPGPPTI
jgi:hypothetical protein